MTLQIVHIAAKSDHPVRNTAGELIFGHHVLWEGKSSHDGDKGSLAPNVFSYDFTSPLASNSLLEITIKAHLPESSAGVQYRLHGAINDSKPIFESDTFSLGPDEETVVVAARVVEPHSSPDPLAFIDTFTWALQRDNGDKVADVGETRLELYWVSADIHEIFLGGLSGIPIDFLRHAFNWKGSSDEQKKTPQLLLTWPQVTQQVFYSYLKIYDTVQGAPHFGVTNTGGHFNYSYYIAGSPVGSLQRFVNCYDQAAMVQVLGNLGNQRPTWLYMQPNGYINTTYLVGVQPQCNNPFFNSRNPALPPLIGINDTRRTGFGNHVFNGYLQVFQPNSPNERIFDACGGPQLGTQTPAGYVSATIDRVTNLYSITGTTPGGVNNIAQYTGVTSITLAAPSLRSGKISEGMTRFIQKCTVSDAKPPYSQIHWDDVAKWAKDVLGQQSGIAYKDTEIGSGVVKALWHLTNVEGVDGDVVIRVRAETRVGEDGDLHPARSAQAAFDSLTSVLQDVELDLGPNEEALSELWAPAPFHDHAQYALQYADGIIQGRILLVSGNFLIDIFGGTSSASLEPVARKLLAHTTVDNPFSRHIPRVSVPTYHIPEDNRGHVEETVKGIASTFDIQVALDGLVAAASADVEGHGLLLSKVTTEVDGAENTSKVTFTFVTRLVGTHDVDLRFAQAPTLSASEKKIQVTVIDA